MVPADPLPARPHQGPAARRARQREPAPPARSPPAGCCTGRSLRRWRRLGGAESSRFLTSSSFLNSEHTLQHGEGLGDKFSVDYIFMAAEKAVGGTPRTGVDERVWLSAFLKARYDLLWGWDQVARVSVRRITMYQKLVELGECTGGRGGRGGAAPVLATAALRCAAAAREARSTAAGTCSRLPQPCPALQHLCWLPPPCVPGNWNLDGPIYVDLEKRTGLNGQPVWQIRDTYYGGWGVHACRWQTEQGSWCSSHFVDAWLLSPRRRWLDRNHAALQASSSSTPRRAWRTPTGSWPS